MNNSTEDLATLYVLDQLDGRDRAAFETRLLRDPALAAQVRDLEIGLAGGIQSLPPREPPAGLFARIEEQLEKPAPLSARPAPATFHWPTFARWGLAAVIAVSLATLAVQSLRPSAAQPVFVFVGLDAGRTTFAELPLKNGAKDADARFMQLATLAENFWTKPANQPVKTSTPTGDSHGYALFDPGSRQGFIAIERLPVLAENQRYHLWIVDPANGRIHDAGSLPLAGMNRGLYSFTLGVEAGLETNRPGFFITVEDNAAAPPSGQPRGRVVLGHQDI
jgi:anti-sigma-K factor RskA